MANSFAYTRGYAAALRCRSINRLPVCPYEGHTDQSMAMQREFMDGVFDALTKPRRQRGTLRAHRKSVRKHWPRSTYARARVMEALQV